MDGSSLAVIGGMGAFGVLASIWSRLKEWLVKCYALVFVSMELRDHVDTAFLVYVRKHFKSGRALRTAVYKGDTAYVVSTKHYDTIAWEMVRDETIYWQGWRPIWIRQTPITKDSNQQETLSVTFLRFTFKTDELVSTAIQEYNKIRFYEGPDRRDLFTITKKVGSHKNDEERGRVRESDQRPSTMSKIHKMTVRIVSHELDDLRPYPPSRPYLQLLALPESHQELVQEAERWQQGQDWFEERGVPWRRGWCLTGLPGTGKSSLARAVCQHLGLCLFVVDVGSYDNEQFVRMWSELRGALPCMVLMEDLDAVFTGRQNKLIQGSTRPGVSFDCLLNCLDGVEPMNGLFLVITTNNVSSLDPALIRPGRIDRVIEMPLFDASTARQMAERIMNGMPEAEIAEISAQGVGLTGAAFQELCTRAAVPWFWNGKPNA